MEQLQTVFLTCEDSLRREGPYCCSIRRSYYYNEKRELYIVSVDPAWKITPFATKQGEIVDELVLCPREIKKKISFEKNCSEIVVNIFLVLKPYPDTDYYLDTEFGRLFLLSIGEVHKTEKDALSFLAM